MAFAKKMIGFPSDLVSFSIKLPSKRHEKTHVPFSEGVFLILERIVLYLRIMNLNVRFN